MSQAQNNYLHDLGQPAWLFLVAAASSKFIPGSSIYANLIGAGIGSVTIILSKGVADPDESAISSFARVTGCVALGILATWGISKLPAKLLKDHVTLTPRAGLMNGLIATAGLIPIAILSASKITKVRHDNFINKPTHWTDLTDKQREKVEKKFSKANLTPIGTKEAKPTKEKDKPEPKIVDNPKPKVVDNPKPKVDDNSKSFEEKFEALQKEMVEFESNKAELSKLDDETKRELLISKIEKLDSCRRIQWLSSMGRKDDERRGSINITGNKLNDMLWKLKGSIPHKICRKVAPLVEKILNYPMTTILVQTTLFLGWMLVDSSISQLFSSAVGPMKPDSNGVCYNPNQQLVIDWIK